MLVRIRALDPSTGAYGLEAFADDGRQVTGTLRLNQEALTNAGLDALRYGMTLSESLLAGDVGQAYAAALRRAESRDLGRLRVRLRIDDEAAEVHAVAWERLHHLHRGRPIPVAISQRTPFSRFTETDFGIETLATRSVRVLFVVSNPTELPEGLPPIAVDDEIRAIHRAVGDLRSRDRITVSILPGRSGVAADLRQALVGDGYAVVDGPASLKNLVRLLGDYDVVHVLSHGHFRRDSPTGAGTAALYLERDDGRWEAVEDDRLADRVAALDPFCPHLLFLSACESARQHPTHPLVGLAPKLVGAGVPAVVGMQAPVPASLARDLTVAFYRSLLDQGLVDVALNAARLHLFDGREVDWAIPVLFSRLPDGRLSVPGDLAGAAVTGKVVLRQTEHGVRADRRRTDRPIRSLPARALPRDVPDLLDRGDEVRAATTSLQAGRSVELVGDEGIGKSTLLRHLVHRVAGSDGVVHGSARSRSVEDLLQYLFDRVYRTEGSYRPTPGELRDALADVRVLFGLDDVELSPDEVGRLMDGAPAAVFLLAGHGPMLTGEGETIRLGGLPVPAAVALFERHLGRPLTEGERADAPALAHAVGGHAQELIQAAARVRDDDVPLGKVVSDAANVRGAAIGSVELATLPEVDRRVLGILAAVGTAPIRAEHLEALTGERELDDVLERLRRRGLVKAASPAFTLAEGIGPEEEAFLEAETWRERVVEHFLGWGERNRKDTGRLLRSLDAILAAMKWAAVSGRRRDYLGLARLVEEPLLVARRWGTWGSVLQRSLEAAEAVGDDAARALAHHQLGTRALGQGHRRAATDDLRRALELRESIGDVEGAALTRHNLRLALPFYRRWRPNRSLIVGAVAGLLAFGIWRVIAGGGALSVDPGELSFPGVEVGTSSIEQTVRVTNGEDAAIRIADVRLSGSDADQFLLEQRCAGRRLASGESCPVRVRFHPTIGGARSATLVVNGVGNEVIVDLEGSGSVTASLRAPPRVQEGNEGDERSAVFTVTLSAPSTDEVNVEFETEGATATADEDYEEQSGTLTFEPRSTDLMVSVPIVGDLLDEPNREAFSLVLTEVHGHEVEGVRAEAIIEDDDPPPSISIAPSSVDESDEGSTEMTFQAVLSEESARQVTVRVTTADESGTAGADYEAIERDLTWEPGETEVSFTVKVLGDVLDEEDERFKLELSRLDDARRPDSETKIEAETAGTIIDNDPPPRLFISDARVNEGDPPASVAAPFDIMLSSASGRPVTVLASTAQSSGLSCMGGPGPAIQGEDYVHRVAEVMIPAGEQRAGFSVPVISDTGTECSETQFLVLLSEASNATIEDAQGVGTIVDDDPVE